MYLQSIQKNRLKSILIMASLSSIAILSHAHTPFLAPQAYVIDGNNTAVTAGFAELPFAAEVALKGFTFQATTPSGDVQKLELKDSKTFTIADLKTPEDGTYTVLATRHNAIEYVHVNNKWLRIMDSKSEQLPPLAERQFITPQEVPAQAKKITSTRYEQLISFLSKTKTTDQHLTPTQGLKVAFSIHPNQIKHHTPVSLSISLDDKAQANYTVSISKQVTHVDEKPQTLELISDSNGQVNFKLPQTGQYFIEVNSPATAKDTAPVSSVYRQNIAIYAQ